MKTGTYLLKKKKEPKRRNPLINNPLYRKSGKWPKKKKKDLQNQDRE